MPTCLELVNELLENEKENQPLYSQLRNCLDDPRLQRLALALRNLQAREINILNRLADELEEEMPEPPPERYYAQHILQSGETLALLARKYNTTVSQIRQYNPGLPDDPQPGQVINLPIEIPKPPTNHFRYYVRSGDTLYKIAQRYGTDVDTLVRLNNISNPDVIFPGRILIIPY